MFQLTENAVGFDHTSR